MNNPFVPTHTITTTSHDGTIRRIAVCLVDGCAYTRSEWNGGDAADWQVTDGRWEFQGRAAPENWMEVEITAVHRACHGILVRDAGSGILYWAPDSGHLMTTAYADDEGAMASAPEADQLGTYAVAPFPCAPQWQCSGCAEHNDETHRWVMSLDGEGDFDIAYTGDDIDEAREVAEDRICAGDYYDDDDDGCEIGYGLRLDGVRQGRWTCRVPDRNNNPHYRG